MKLYYPAIFIPNDNGYTKESFETMNKIAELICFHAKCRENGELMMKPFHINKKLISTNFIEDCNNE